MRTVGFELKQAARRVFTWKQTGAILIPAIGLALATIMFRRGLGVLVILTALQSRRTVGKRLLRKCRG